MRVFLLFLTLGLAACHATPVTAGETRADRMGITVNAANRNAALIRRSQARDRSLIVRVPDSGVECCAPVGEW